MSSFKCLPGCGKCCYPIIFEKAFWTDHKHLAARNVIETYNPMPFQGKLGEMIDLVLPIGEGLRCPFLREEDKLCNIYESRPETCSTFGIENGCHYVKPDGSPRTERGTKQAVAKKGFDLEKESSVYHHKVTHILPDGHRIKFSQHIDFERREE